MMHAAVLLCLLAFQPTRQSQQDDPFLEEVRKYEEKFDLQRAEAKKQHPQCFKVETRSPIDINSFTAQPVYYSPIEFLNYNETGSVTRDTDTNVTDALIGFSDWDKRPAIEGGGLKGRFYLDEIHVIHNGAVFNPGVARRGHSINKAFHDIELHLVHVADGLSLEEAELKDGAIAIVVVFVDVDFSYHREFKIVNDKAVFLHTPEQQHILRQPLFPSRLDEANETSSTAMRPALLLPTDTETFYRYNGSLVHAPCTPGVVWTIIVNPIYIRFDEYLMHWGARDIKWLEHLQKIGQYLEEMPAIENRTVLVNMGRNKKDDGRKLNKQGMFCVSTVTLSLPSLFLVAVISACASVGGIFVFLQLTKIRKQERLSFDNIAMENKSDLVS